jgi:hypothetical protein
MTVDVPKLQVCAPPELKPSVMVKLLGVPFVFHARVPPWDLGVDPRVNV